MDTIQTRNEKKKKKTNNNYKKICNSIDQQNLLCEAVRLHGKQKLLYIKQTKLKRMPYKQFFTSYPYCKFPSFSFNIQILQTVGTIIQQQNGIHWVQSSHFPSITSNIIEKALINGWAISIFNDGRIVQGIYHNSQLCGLCYQLQPDGNTYIGNFNQGYKQGIGAYYWFSSNQVYVGEWLGGVPHGQGKYIGIYYYEGQFCNGIKDGNGEQLFKNGDRYIGQFINGVANGYGKYIWIDGSIYKGYFKHGLRHGYGIWNSKNDRQKYSGFYRMDKKDGFGVYQWANKQYYEGCFKQNFRQGYGRLYLVYPKMKNNLVSQGKIVQMHKLVFDGMWQKGKQKSSLPIQKDCLARLQGFLAYHKSHYEKKIKRCEHKYV